MATAAMFRPEYALWDHQSGTGYMEKRQLFLRSYHFSRKRSPGDRVRRSLIRVKRLICVRLRAVRRLPRLAWSRLLRSGWSGRRRFHRLVVIHPHRSSTSSDCSW